MNRLLRIPMCVAGALLVACAWGADGPASPPPGSVLAKARERVKDVAILGKMLFFDPSLSASGQQSCASCHSPEHDYAQPNDLTVQLGGPDMNRPGTRAVPSLKYLHTAPQFIEHYYAPEEEGGDGSDQGPTGGLMWDGRAPTRKAQAILPLLNPDEMANPDAAAVVAKVKAAPYADTLRKLYGEHIFDDTQKAIAAISEAIDYYEQTPADFFPFDSKYDAYLAGKTTLSAQEMHGLKVFLDPDGGNCASCHKFAAPGILPIFNDFGLIAVGVPRNPEIPANADPDYHDMGLCGPLRTDLQDHPEYCGLFRSPTLRNVARRKVFFHNGYFRHLRDVVEFYARRDTNPEKYYPRRPDGSIAKFDDLPNPKYRENVNMDGPFGGNPGDKPAMSEQDIDDVVAFLQTLNDGFTKPSPSANPPAP